MKIRDTALSNEGRLAAGRWLKSLRETRGISQSELAAELGAPHYTFVSQMETGRRSIPTYYIDKLASSLRVSRTALAMQMLRHQDPFMHSALFGTEDEFAELLDQLMIDPKPQSLQLEKTILKTLSQAGIAGLDLTSLRVKVEEVAGRELHYQSVSQTLRKLEKDGLVHRRESVWATSAGRASKGVGQNRSVMRK